MYLRKPFLSAVFIGLFFSVSLAQSRMGHSKIIPAPLHHSLMDGHFVLDGSIGITFDDTFAVAATFLKSYIENGSTIRLQKGNGIRFVKDGTIENPEGYKLEILPRQITIRASTERGAFYAVQSLRQLLPPTFENSTFATPAIHIPCQTIEDTPRFSYRGMHLDVVRHFFPVAFIKKYIDALAMLKLNTFHWHLTDDQGWRIEIKAYPKLQDIAAFRNETLIGHYNAVPQRFDGKRYGGYYTQEEIKEIVAYASMRQVTIIPEIEMPGHAQAAIAAYPELGCTEAPIDVATSWGVFDDIFCPKETTFAFLENVLDEVLALFPGTYIHIGGDEAPKTRWKHCAHCQDLIRKEGLKDEHGLQSYFVSRMERYLNAKGRQIIGWDEILEGGLAPNATVMSWRGIQGAVEAAKQRHKVIMTPTSHCYFDYYQSDKEGEPLAIGGYLPLEKVYHFNPIPNELNADEAQYVWGAQGNLWTEYLASTEQVEYMVFPRMLALCEVVWSAPESKNYDDFVRRLEQFHPRLDALDIQYANHLFEIEGNVSQVGYALTTQAQGKTIRYTLDGSLPNLDSKIYSKAIPITKSTVIKAAVFNHEKQLGSMFSQHINYHKGVGKKIRLSVPPNKAYPGSGAQGLINGISGSDTRFGDKEWLGFWGDDVEITIDLGEEIEIYSIETRFYNAPGQWIYPPESIAFGIDAHGAHLKAEVPKSIDKILNVKILLNKKTDSIHLKIPNYGTIPEGQQGAGQKAWTFIDEIIIH